MTKKRFQKRYIKKNNKVYDTWKKMPITNELNSDSLLNVISHLNGLGEIIDSQIEQGRYCFGKYYELKEENEQLKSEKVELLEENITYKNAWIGLKDERDEQCEEIKEYEQLIIELNDIKNKYKKVNEQLKQRIKELEIENTAQSDAIDGLQEILTHLDLDKVM